MLYVYIYIRIHAYMNDVGMEQQTLSYYVCVFVCMHGITFTVFNNHDQNKTTVKVFEKLC